MRRFTSLPIYIKHILLSVDATDMEYDYQQQNIATYNHKPIAIPCVYGTKHFSQSVNSTITTQSRAIITCNNRKQTLALAILVCVDSETKRIYLCTLLHQVILQSIILICSVWTHGALLNIYCLRWKDKLSPLMLIEGYLDDKRVLVICIF